MDNIIERHFCLQKVSMKIRNYHEVFRDFETLTHSEEFKSKFDKAVIEGENSDMAKEIESLLNPYVNFISSGNKSEVFSLSQKNAIKHAMALVDRFGLPSLFITISPSYVKDVDVFQFAVGCINSLPKDQNMLLEELQNDEKNTFLKYNIPSSILDEPVACARCFICFIHLVLEELFG